MNKTMKKYSHAIGEVVGDILDNGLEMVKVEASANDTIALTIFAGNGRYLTRWLITDDGRLFLNAQYVRNLEANDDVR